jgi:hypothetical protein
LKYPSSLKMAPLVAGLSPMSKASFGLPVQLAGSTHLPG